jgi:arylsulfatase A-like enzyme
MPKVLLVGLDDASRREFTRNVCPRIFGFRQTAWETSLAFSHPVCSPSRAGILFGSYGKKIGTIGDIGFTAPGPLTPPASLLTLPGVLRAAGYQTCLVGKWHCGPAPSGAHWALGPYERGYDSWLAGTRLNVEPTYRSWQRTDVVGQTFTVVDDYSSYVCRTQVDEAKVWWARQTGNRRFMHVALNLPHPPFHVPPAGLLAGWPAPGAQDPDRARFLAMLRAADTLFGELVDFVGPETAVFLYSDNGTPYDAVAPALDPGKSKQTTFDPGINVLLMGRWKQNPVGLFPQLTSLIDVSAAILAVCGVPVPQAWDAVLGGRKHVLSEGRFTTGWQDRAVRTYARKLRQLKDPGGMVAEQLYDLRADPREEAPLDLIDPVNQADLAALRQILAVAALPP